MRWPYLGSKQKLTGWLWMCIAPLLDGKPDPVVADLCAGACSVSRMLVGRGVGIISNDALLTSYVIQQARLLPWASREEETLARQLVDRLDALSPAPGFIHDTYTPAGGRMYFTEETGARIDAIRAAIRDMRPDLSHKVHVVLLACLMLAACNVANTSSMFAAFLKRFKPKALKRLTLSFDDMELPPYSPNAPPAACLNQDACEVAGSVAQSCDVVYVDPPYNTRDYGFYMYVLDTIARGDQPAVHGFVGQPDQRAPTSRFCLVRSHQEALAAVLRGISGAEPRRATHVVLSYSTDGLLDRTRLEEMLAEFGDVRVHEREHDRLGGGHVTELALVVKLK